MPAGPRRRPARLRRLPLLLALLALPAPGASGFELLDGAVQIHGFVRSELRALSHDFEPGSDWYASQLAQTLNAELEWELAPRGLGPLESAALFARAELRFDCIFADGCGVFDSRRTFGDDARHAPSDVWTDGKTFRKSGVLVFRQASDAHRGTRLLPFFHTPEFEPLIALGGDVADANLARIFAPLQPVALTAFFEVRGAFDEEGFILGPWNRDSRVHSLATIHSIPSTTPALPLRPAVPAPGSGPLALPQGLWVPNAALRAKYDDLDERGAAFNLSEGDLRWNHGAGQGDENELKELYLDLEFLAGRLFVRGGKQTIVWGKTELFRNQDQFNPQDVGLSTLPSFEESRLALWSLRAIYSFYDVGPLEDLRLEVAAILDEFQSIDAGTCGEPYAVFLVCRGSFGFLSHGFSGLGVAGAELPPDPWDDLRGLEAGVRVEWRYRRFSFALTDFYGYSDTPHAELFYRYERRVDPASGRPLDILGRPFDVSDPASPALAERALLFHPQNRQLYDLACALSFGVAGQFIPELADDCALSVFNNDEPLAAGGGLVAVADAFALVLNGTALGEFILEQIAGLPPGSIDLVDLNVDPADGPPPMPDLFCKVGGFSCLSQRLTDAQEALLGCGPFYGTNCDVNGIDFFNAEASVLFQSFPMFEPGGPVATRLVDGELRVLPGARGPADAGYDPLVDGCVDPAAGGCGGAMLLVNPDTGQPFASEMAALSFNFLRLLVGFGSTNDPGCDPADPVTCSFVRGLFILTGAQLPVRRAGGNGVHGRRDFLWAGGGPILLRFQKRNVLGLAIDFDEDFTKTSWGIELTWFAKDAFADDESPDLVREADVFNLTVSFDRPTFVNFLNANRTILFNTQLFLQKVTGRSGLSALGTLTLLTGYFQDRLQSQVTFVHDLRTASGGVIWQLGYRFTANFSVTLGVTGFYGGPQRARQPVFPPRVRNNGGSFSSRSDFSGLSLLSERDEVSLVVRYTF